MLSICLEPVTSFYIRRIHHKILEPVGMKKRPVGHDLYHCTGWEPDGRVLPLVDVCCTGLCFSTSLCCHWLMCAGTLIIMFAEMCSVAPHMLLMAVPG